MKKASEHGELIVRESIVVLTLISIFMLLMIASILFYNTNAGDWTYLVIAALVPVIAYLIRKKITRAIITINKHGIYSHNNLIASWDNFYSARIEQLPMKIGNPADQVALTIQILDERRENLLEKRIRLHNTLNKSEEQILEAIERFRKH